MNPTAPHSSFIEFRSSAIHGNGGFAACAIPAGTRLIEYVGERILLLESKRRCDAGNPFIFHFDAESDLDGNVEWNPARWLNHSCEPNCEAEQDEDEIWILSLRDIVLGEELSFNYGYDLADYRDNPCRCNTARCVGFMVAEEHFSHVLAERRTPN